MQGDLFRSLATICDPTATESARTKARCDAITEMNRAYSVGSLVLPDSLSDAEADAIVDVILD